MKGINNYHWKFSFLLSGFLVFSLTSCTNSSEKDIFISYQEVKKQLDSVQKIPRKENSHLFISLFNSKDTVKVIILPDERKTVRKNKRNRSLYTPYLSLDSVIKILQNRVEDLPGEKEKSEPEIFFVDSKTDNDLIKIIPARLVITLSEDNFGPFE